jgi:mono/diheme cytochrome c family protein
VRRAWLALAAIVTVAAPAGADPLYDRYCLACHGEAGDGAGPAARWLWPKPRDFGKALYRFRSTASGKPPTDDDLARTIRDGLPGTSMPAFGDALDDAQVRELVGVVKAFAPKKFGKPAAPVPIPTVPADLSSRADAGAKVWAKAGCAQCHGDGLRGDGPSAAGLEDEHGRAAPPTDLGARPLKRGGAAGVYATLATGLDGANMPAFAGALSDGELWDLVAFVEARRWKGAWPSAVAGPIDARAADGAVTVLGLELAPQGDPPASLPPAAASLSSAQCGRCHARQLRDWKTSLHARTASPGTLGQLVGASDELITGCQRCHMPLAEQLPGGAAFSSDLRGEGVTCAACHVRGWTRRGPPRAGDSKLLADPSYPFVPDARYERSDFCLPCHQLAPDDLVLGRPLLDTYREWLEGPYMRRGVQCQHCHMPEREHTWRGAHDQTTVQQGVRLAARAARDGARVRVDVSVDNVGAGHFLPTTPTPAGFLEVELLDEKDGDKPLASQTKRIGRHLVYQNGWKQVEDSRIPPGGSLAFAPVFDGDAARRARRVRVRLRWKPDDYYEGFFTALLRAKLSAESRALIEAALERTKKSEFVVWERTLPL